MQGLNHMYTHFLHDNAFIREQGGMVAILTQYNFLAGYRKW